MDELIKIFGPYVVSGGVAALSSWVIMKIELAILRRDVDGMRERIHGPRNPNSITNVLQAHGTRLTILETIEERKPHDHY